MASSVERSRLLQQITQYFPGLASGGVRITSKRNPNYNCVAWAAGITDRVLQPNQHEWLPVEWPIENHAHTLAACAQVMATFGYRDTTLRELEPGVQRIAIYGTPERFLHVSRQLVNGWWASKLGIGYDIEHETLEQLEGKQYGQVQRLMARRRTDSDPEPLDSDRL